MKKNITFIPYAGRELAHSQAIEHNYRLGKVKALLSTKGEDTIEEFLKYQSCPTRKRDKVIAECEIYIKDTAMPLYLQADARQRAFESCDNYYIENLQSLLSSLPTFQDGEIVEQDDEWVVSPSFTESLLQKYARTFTDEEMKAYGIYQELCEKAKELHALNFYLNEGCGAYDALCPLSNWEAEVERFLNYRKLTEAERKKLNTR